MQHADVIELDGKQAICLPEDIRFDTDRVSIRRDGESVILEAPPLTEWPEVFFEAIRIADPAFERPPQGEMPPAPTVP